MGLQRLSTLVLPQPKATDGMGRVLRSAKQQSWLTVYYRLLHANTMPLTSAVLNFVVIHGVFHSWMATLYVKDMFFMVSLWEHDKV